MGLAVPHLKLEPALGGAKNQVPMANVPGQTVSHIFFSSRNLTKHLRALTDRPCLWHPVRHTSSRSLVSLSKVARFKFIPVEGRHGL